MFSDIIKGHHERRVSLNEQVSIKAKQTSDSIEKLSEHLLVDLNHGVSVVYSNQQTIEEEIKKLQQNTNKFIKISNRWVAVYNNFNDALKELGDVKDWGIAIENDLDLISSSLSFIIQPDSKEKSKK